MYCGCQVAPAAIIGSSTANCPGCPDKRTAALDWAGARPGPYFLRVYGGPEGSLYQNSKTVNAPTPHVKKKI